MQKAFLYSQPVPVPQPRGEACNSLSRAWETLRQARDLTPPVEAALSYIEFVFNGAVKIAVRDLRQYLPKRHQPAAGETVLAALDTIRIQLERSGAFFFPLDDSVAEDQLVREALAALQAALDASLDRDVRDARVREALRFLLWKTGGQWTYVNFWNSLTYKGGNGLWQNGQVALREIRTRFPQGH